MNTTRTDTEIVVGVLLDQDVEAFVKERRPDMSWPAISAEILKMTGRRITEQTLRRWNETWQLP